MADPLAAPPGPPAPAAAFPRVLLALIVGQIGMHAAMAGVRMAAPLQALREGHSAFTVGVLMALYAAAPVLLSLPAGRMADRHGYHRPVYLAVCMSVCGAVLAVASTYLEGGWHFGLLCLSAMFVGAGANFGIIAIQRTAGLSARSSTERVRVFSWLGMAPSLSNVVGPVSAGFMIDAGGFRAAYLLMLALPLLTLWGARQVPRERPPQPAAAQASGTAWELLAAPGLKRLLFVNWVLSACWDVHAFAVPVLGVARGFSATTIGLVLGSFTLAVTGVRFLIPLLAHRMNETTVLVSAMVATGVVFGLYPLAGTPWLMGGCALLLGLSLGAVQPMIMSTLHRLTPDNRHGEAIAFRSMVMNGSSTLMPLLFGLLGATVGAAPLFWMMGAAVAAGAWPARRLAPA